MPNGSHIEGPGWGDIAKLEKRVAELEETLDSGTDEYIRRLLTEIVERIEALLPPTEEDRRVTRRSTWWIR